VKLLIFSSSSIVETNRSYIRKIALNFGIDIHLAILYKKASLNQHNGIDDFSNEPFDVSLHELSGLHPRIESFKNVKNFIESVNPSHILLEFDPATYITYKVVTAIKKKKIFLGLLVLENRKKNFLFDSFRELKEFNFKLFFGNLMCLFFNTYNRSRIDVLFPISNESCQVYYNLGYPDNKIIKIPLGIDTTLFTKLTHTTRLEYRNKLNLTKFTIAYFGRLVPEKGVDLLIMALKNQKYSDWQLLLDNFSVYSSDYTEYLSKLIKKYNLSDHVVFFDCKHKEMPFFYNAVDLVVLPSIETKNFKEQYGRVLVESMLCKTLLIGSDTGAIPEIINNPFLLFESGNISSMTNKLNEIRELNQNILEDLVEINYRRSYDELGVDTQSTIIYKALIRFN
jgi:glycosyltransferase involved in cell wall biosynthesis